MKQLRRSTSVLALAAGLCLANAAQAGTIYIPLPGFSAVGTATYETRVGVTNSSTQQSPIKFLQLATNVNGTLRTGITPSSLPIAAGLTAILRPVATAPALLEISSANTDFQYSARLVGLGALAGTGIELPVISSENLAPADSKLVLQGLRSATTQTADLVIVNLNKAASSCTITVLRADGTPVFAAATISMLPLSHRHFPDIFAQITGGIADARAVLTCNGDFYGFAQMRDTATGEYSVATPTQTASSLLAAPGETPTLSCSTGTVCFTFPGLVHHSTTGNPARSITLNPPVAAYSSVRLHLEVEVGPWHGGGAHGLVYFIRDKNKDMYANVFLKGPSRNSITLRHGFNQTHGQKAKIERSFAAQTGQTYALDYDYNPVADSLALTISHRGQVVVRMDHEPNVNRVHIDPGQNVIVGLSNPGTNPSIEPASYGWKYHNLKVEFVP